MLGRRTSQHFWEHFLVPTSLLRRWALGLNRLKVAPSDSTAPTMPSMFGTLCCKPKNHLQIGWVRSSNLKRDMQHLISSLAWKAQPP
uniref:Uncharacterized protein n=1 Tax=Peach sooty ringspot virus TaxID=145398 RepID=Q9DKY6_9VIRU|nr:unknown [Peach sooty ringspot virus]